MQTLAFEARPGGPFDFADADGRPVAHPAFPDWPLDAVGETTVTFEEEGRKTRLTIEQRITPASAAAHPSVIEEGLQAREGWDMVLESLAQDLRTLA